jgi:hypothetical protein
MDVEFYLSIKNNSEIPVFERNNNDSFVLYGDHARLADKITNVSSSQGIDTCVLSRQNLSLFLAKYADNKSILFYKCIDKKWQVTRKSSPGNWSEIEDLIESVFESTTISVKCAKKDNSLVSNILLTARSFTQPLLLMSILDTVNFQTLNRSLFSRHY